jgi:hypothetical protein
VSKVLSFDFEYDHDYTLIGIHSILEDFRIAYFLNLNLNINLKRFEEDLDFPSKNCSFPFYIYENEATFTTWSLISNKYVYADHQGQLKNKLFNEVTKTSYLITEKNTVDYFIKINGILSPSSLQNILTKINNTFHIITSYSIDPYNLKSKENLIF